MTHAEPGFKRKLSLRHRMAEAQRIKVKRNGLPDEVLHLLGVHVAVQHVVEAEYRGQAGERRHKPQGDGPKGWQPADCQKCRHSKVRDVEDGVAHPGQAEESAYKSPKRGLRHRTYLRMKGARGSRKGA